MIDAGRIVALDTPRALKARLGGGVIRLQTDDDAQVRTWLWARGLTPEPGGADVMLVHADPAAVLPEVLRALPVKVHRATVSEPSLEDVFLKLTGRGLDGDAPAVARPGGPGERGAA